MFGWCSQTKILPSQDHTFWEGKETPVPRRRTVCYCPDIKIKRDQLEYLTSRLYCLHSCSFMNSLCASLPHTIPICYHKFQTIAIPLFSYSSNSASALPEYQYVPPSSVVWLYIGSGGCLLTITHLSWRISASLLVTSRAAAHNCNLQLGWGTYTTFSLPIVSAFLFFSLSRCWLLYRDGLYAPWLPYIHMVAPLLPTIWWTYITYHHLPKNPPLIFTSYYF